ncbi:hypothetical protein INR49_026888 [Caranx melampygus]|nr:hypothetical protein INR49_026888 [Caranx melampygus]
MPPDQDQDQDHHLHVDFLVPAGKKETPTGEGGGGGGVVCEAVEAQGGDACRDVEERRKQKKSSAEISSVHTEHLTPPHPPLP